MMIGSLVLPGKMEVFRAVFVLFVFLLKNCNSYNTHISHNSHISHTTPDLDHYSVEPTRETYSKDYYYDYQDYQSEGTTGSYPNNGGSMQDNFFALFDWRRHIPTSGNDTFLDDDRTFLRDIAETCPKRGFFYGMNPRHNSAVLRLNQILMEQRSPEGCLQMAGSLRDRDEVNPHAWLRAVISASIFRNDLQGLRKPPLVEVMPSMFVPGEILDDLKESASNEVSTNSHKCVRVDGSYGEDNGDENLVWYWREDVLLSSHHLYWHLSYPIRGERGAQDRSGELFYFMHHNMNARFLAERLSVGLPPVEPWDLRPGQTIPYGYNPHLHDGNSGANYSARPPGVPVSDLVSDRPVSVRNRTIWLNRVLDGIAEGRLIDQYGHPVYLDNDDGINVLGNTLQSNALSVNPDYYGENGVHNSGHRLIGAALDPRLELGHPPGVMGEDATAIRDIIFYPYHAWMDTIFNAQKNRLAPYELSKGAWPLVLPGIELQSIKIHSGDLRRNTLNTFWSYKRYDLARGLDFNRSATARGPLYACHQHLEHQDFEYELEIERKDESFDAKTATVRIFMGPRYDLEGRRYTLDEQRHYMFIVDAFTVPLKVGPNTIRRPSVSSALTVDFPTSLGELRQEPTSANNMPFCGCGWPQHMLIPKGTKKGLDLDVFAVITSSKEDAVKRDTSTRTQKCRAAWIFCGIADEKYPDARPMGYPFDRRLYITEQKQPGPGALLEHLVKDVPNMASVPIKVMHFDEIRGGDAVGDLIEDYHKK